MFLTRIIQKIFHSLGFSIVKYQPKKTPSGFLSNGLNAEGADKLKWLTKYQFESIIDIGANEGQFTYKILTVFPSAEIHCFEPLKDVFVQLQENFRSASNVRVYNFGLGEHNEEKLIFNNEYSPSSSLLEMKGLHKSNFDFAIKVQPKSISIQRLDDVFSMPLKKPLLVKIDVQGYEMFVLKGGESTISHADMIIIETSFYSLYKDQPLFHDIYKILTSKGFIYAGSIEQLLTAGNEILQADAVFINRNIHQIV